MEWDKIYEEEAPIEMNGIQIEEWEKKYLDVFEKDDKYGQNAFLPKLEVCHKEIDWKIAPVDILKANTWVNYDVGEVSEKEAPTFMKKLKEE